MEEEEVYSSPLKMKSISDKLKLGKKKGQLGLDTVKAVVIAFLILAVLGVTVILLLTSLRDPAEAIDRTTRQFGNLTTLTVVNETGAFISGAQELRNCQATIFEATNSSDELIIQNPGNYTISACLITYVGIKEDDNNSLWNVSGSYIFSEDSTFNIQGNVTEGVVSFFNEAGTLFSILAVIVIILAIGIIIIAVGRFGGGGAGRGL